MNAKAVTERWWGEFDVPAEGAGRWRVGPLSLWIRRGAREWRLERVRGADYFEDTLEVVLPCDEEPVEGAVVTRFAMKRTGASMHLAPALADRPLVVAPSAPFYLPPGEETVLFVSSPLWFQFKAAAAGPVLLEEPVFRPSDTWFGSNTRQGELCYASRTRARLQLENMVPRTQRAFSAVPIGNRSLRPLLLERMRLPMPNLSLFEARDGLLWTETLHLDHPEEGVPANVRLGRDPGPDAGAASRVAGPRQVLERGLFEAFGGLFARREEDGGG